MKNYGVNKDPSRQQATGHNVYCDECGRIIWSGKNQQWTPHHKWGGFGGVEFDGVPRFAEAAADCGASHWFCEDCLDMLELGQGLTEDPLFRHEWAVMLKETRSYRAMHDGRYARQLLNFVVGR